MTFLTLLTALALSGVSAYYSVIGLAAIFPGSFWPIIIMGSVLEMAKLVTVSWLYRNWKTCPLLMKSYYVTACVILMLITSMGIFGYLSKAHLEHSADTAPLSDKVAMLDEKIKTEKENMDGNRKILKQLDEGVDQVMARSSDEKGADKAVAIRKAQQKDRSRISQEIQESQRSINVLNEERAPLNVALQKAESDFGPIKYVAELVYGSGERDLIDKAVRLVIMLIMTVFDPLAILLLISANMTWKIKEEPEPENPEQEFFDKVGDISKKLDEDAVQIKKENLATILEKAEPKKELKPKYDYDEPFAFKEKKQTDGGTF
jgi:hypothetical protein